MKSNRIVYILIVILITWCFILTSMYSNVKKEYNETIVNQYTVSGFSTDLTKVIDNVKDKIVTVNAGSNVATGFVYEQRDEKVYILTANHSIANSNNVYISFLSSLNYPAKVIGTNKFCDLAVLEIETPFNINRLNLADSTLLKDGEFVISIGTPISNDYAKSAELGLVSSKIRTIENEIEIADESIKYYLDTIQLSANLNPGYSGSPVFNMNGEVLGMTTMSLANKLNFAITANEIRIIADNIINNQENKKYQLGIKGTYVNDMPAYERSSLDLSVDIRYGLYVDDLLDNSISTIAGIKSGDVVLSINGINLVNYNDYLNVAYSNTNYFEFEVLSNTEINKYRVEIND